MSYVAIANVSVQNELTNIFIIALENGSKILLHMTVYTNVCVIIHRLGTSIVQQ